MPEQTPVFDLYLPTPGGDKLQWGDYLNANFELLDTLVSLNRKRSVTWALPYLPAAGTFQVLGFRREIVTAGTLASGPATTVAVGTSKLAFNIVSGADLTGVISLAGDSRHISTGAVVSGDTETIAVSGAGVYTSGKCWVGDVDISTTNLTIADYDVYSLSLFNTDGQPLELESVQFLGTSSAAGRAATITLERYRKSGSLFIVDDLLDEILDVATTPAGVVHWDMTYALATPLIRSDEGEGLLATVALTGGAGEWKDLRLILNFKIKPNA